MGLERVGNEVVRYHKHQRFKPADEKEHAKANRGYDVPDYCQNCRRPMMAHYNGACPMDEED